MSRPHPNRRWAWTMATSVVLAVLVGFLGIRWLTPDCEGDGCPSVERLRGYRPPEPPRIYDADGELAGQLSGPKRLVVPLDSIPPVVRQGYIAVEDRRFRQHGGVDVTGALRALVRNLRSQDVEEGASTITMQLARNMFGPEVLDWNRWHRKLAEFRLARQIEHQLTKDEILELYLNQIYLGDGVYGVGTAARHYFGRSVSRVTPRQAALLVGLAKNPEGYDPRQHPREAAERIATVLDIFEREDVLSPGRVREAREADLELADSADATTGWGANAYYLSAVRRELREIFPDPRDRQGLRVHTGLDPEGQAAAVRDLDDQIHAIEAGHWGAFHHPVPEGDLERVGGSHSPYLQGMVVAMRPDDGLVTTLVGGRDYRHSEFDRAFQARRQPGSAFKPIVYAAALGRGLRLDETISTDPVHFARRGREDWSPSDHVEGQTLTVRDALVRSSNTAAVRVGERIGTGAVIRQAHAMGIRAELPDYPSVYLGAGDVVPARLVAAYATFANGGHTVEPYLITRVEDPEGREVYRHEPAAGRRAVDPRIAFLVLDVLRDVTTRGTGWRVGRSGLSYPAAGKTGTTNGSRDAWFVGFTPKLVAGVWLGFDEPETIVPGGAGGTLAAPVWARFMQTANRDLGPMEPWTPPPGVTRARVVESPGLGSYELQEDCPVPPDATVHSEYFLSGSQPPLYCPWDRGRQDRYGRWDDTSGRGEGRGWDDGRYDDATADSTRRTIFWRGDDDPVRDRADRDRLRREREERLDSLERAAREGEDGDTGRNGLRGGAGRRDTTVSDTTTIDTIRADTIRADTLRTDTTTTDRVRRDTTRADTTTTERPGLRAP